MTVLAIFATAAAYSLQSSLTATSENQARVAAAGLVSQELDSAQATTFSSIRSLNGHVSTQAVGATTYTVTDSVQEVAPPSGAGSGACAFTAAGTDGHALVVNVSVTWPRMRATPVVGQVELSPPANVISAGYATLTVHVSSASLQPVAGAALTLSLAGAAVQTQTTDATGCASFVTLAPAQTYVVSGTGLIDQSQGEQGSNPAVAQWSTGVLAASSYSYQELTWDHPASLTPGPVTVPSPFVAATGCTTIAGAACPSGAVLGSSVTLQAGSAVGGNAPDQLAGVAGTKNVFPFTAGWKAWAGDCTDASSDTVAATTTAGQPTTVSPVLVGVSLTPSSALANAGAGHGVIYAQHAADTTCTGGEILSWSAPTGSTTTVKAALPAGTWTFYRYPQTAATGVTLTLATNNTSAGTLP